jgi:CDP-diglyceride synthetase
VATGCLLDVGALITSLLCLAMMANEDICDVFKRAFFGKQKFHIVMGLALEGFITGACRRAILCICEPTFKCGASVKEHRPMRN